MAEGGFEELCRQHYARVAWLGYLITGDRHEALDLAQEAFARAYERWKRISALDRPEAWVERVAVNLALSRRRRARRAIYTATPPDTPVPSAEPVDPWLARALGELTQAQRAVIALRFLFDWSVDQVADALRKRPGTVRALTAQGMERLRGMIGREVPDEARG